MARHLSLRELLLHDQGLLGDRRSRETSAHILTCGKCQALRAQVTGKLRGPGPDLAPAEEAAVWSRIAARTATVPAYSTVRPPRTAARARYLAARLATAAAALALVAGGVFLARFQTGGEGAWSLQLARANGPVTITRDGGALTIRDTLPVAEGARLSTAAAASADVRLGTNSGIRILPESVVAFEELRTRKNAHRASVRLDRGSLLVRLDRVQAGTELRLDTPHAALLVTGTRFFLDVGADQTTLVLFEGGIRDERSGRTTAPSVSRTRITRDSFVTEHLKETPADLASSDILSRTLSFEPGATAVATNRSGAPAASKRSEPDGFRERVLLNDGTVLTGSILEQKKDRLVLRTKYGVVTIDAANVRKIEYLQDGK